MFPLVSHGLPNYCFQMIVSDQTIALMIIKVVSDLEL